MMTEYNELVDHLVSTMPRQSSPTNSQQMSKPEAPFDTPAYQNYRELIMTSEEDKFMHMDEGELISECLQIAALLGGTCTRTSTVDSSGRESKKIIIEYDIQRRDKEASKET